MMTIDEKLCKLKSIMNISGDEADGKLLDYLKLSEQEILNWMYINRSDKPDDAKMPKKYDITQIYAVVAALSGEGGENEVKHSENGISRTFMYSDMVEYIRAHVFQLV